MEALLVEDSATMRKLFRQLLEHRGHRVAEVSTAEAGWDICRESVRPLIILDWMLPGMDGLELCRRIRALPHGDRCVILVVTSRNSADDLAAVLAAGASDYLPKSSGLEALAVRLAVAERQVGDIQRRMQAEEAMRAEQEQRYAALERLRASEESLRRLIEAAPVGMSITDCEGNLEVINAAFSAFFGCSNEELAGKPWNLLIPLGPSGKRNGMPQLADRNEGPSEWEVRTRDGQCRTALGTALTITGYDGTPRMVFFIQDITDRKRTERRLAHLAHHDPLTGLPNRALFVESLSAALQTAAQREQHLAVLFIDLDGFKRINDVHGHKMGDLLLKTVSKRLSHCVRTSDLVARLAGDEFTVLLPNVGSERIAISIAQRIIAEITMPITIEGIALHVTTSVGIGQYPDDAHTSDQLLAMADAAMYEAKRGGKNAYAVARVSAAPIDPERSPAI